MHQNPPGSLWQCPQGCHQGPGLTDGAQHTPIPNPNAVPATCLPCLWPTFTGGPSTIPDPCAGPVFLSGLTAGPLFREPALRVHWLIPPYPVILPPALDMCPMLLLHPSAYRWPLQLSQGTVLPPPTEAPTSVEPHVPRASLGHPVRA